MAKITTRFNGAIDWEVYQEHLVNQIFKLLPLRDEGKDWERYLNGLLIELNGLEYLTEELNFISLLGKLAGLPFLTEEQIAQGYYKKIVFDSIHLAKSLSPKVGK